MFIVSGCPRSGTSMMTLILKTMLEPDGYEVLGEKFPQENRFDRKQRRREKKQNETAKQFELREYLMNNRPEIYIKEKGERETKIQEQLEETKKMNPMGFWECKYTVNGAQWHLGIDDICTPKKICKIVSQGLINTDPRFCEKVIFMLRKPAKVASSQEHLGRENFDKFIGGQRGKGGMTKVHDVTMFIKVTQFAAAWFNRTGVKPLIVEYDEFTSNPDKGLREICEYLGAGDPDLGKPIISEKLKRSEDKKIDPDGSFSEADEIYELMLKYDFQGILNYRAKKNARSQQSFPCLRLKCDTNYNHCVDCKKGGEFAYKMREYAEQQNIDHGKEPCVFECGFDPDRYDDDSYLSVKESIENSHWKNIEWTPPTVMEAAE